MAVVRKVSAMDVVSYTFVTVVSLMCFLPFVYVISVSLTAPDSYVPYRFYFFPKQFSLDVYRYILGTDSFLNALKSKKAPTREPARGNL